MAGQLGDDQVIQDCRRAAELSKADLLTGIVGEFPTCKESWAGVCETRRGVVGRQHGDSRTVHATGDGGELPESVAGKVLPG